MRNGLVLASLFGMVAGCGGPLYMRPAARTTPSCASDAYVVFVRPGHSGIWRQVEIREADGSYLGRLTDSSYFGVSVAPGRHFFVATLVTTNGEPRPIALTAELAPARSYFVDVELSHGFPILYAVAPRHSYWTELEGWLEGSDRLERDPLVAGLPPFPGYWEGTYQRASEWWASLDRQGLFERTLLVSDGSSDPRFASSTEACVERAPKPTITEAKPIDPSWSLEHIAGVDVPECRTEIPTGSHMPAPSCKTARQRQAERDDASRYLNRPRGSYAHPD